MIAAAAVYPCQPPWHPPVDLSHLNEEQRAEVSAMLCEEASAFAPDSNDVGCIPSLKMSIAVQDQIPVKGTYHL